MSNESDQSPEPTSAAQEPEKSEKSEEPRFNWEYREEFRINTKMREVIKLTKLITESEIDRLRRKVEKLTYGS